MSNLRYLSNKIDEDYPNIIVRLNILLIELYPDKNFLELSQSLYC